MAENDFFQNQSNRYRGGRYPSFNSGGINSAGNVTGVATGAANPGLLDTSGGAVSEGFRQIDTASLKQALPEVPSVGNMVKNAAIGAALPYAGSTIGSAAGSAMAGGATFGTALGEGVKTLGTKVGGFLGGAGTAGTAAAGSTAAGSAAGSTAAGAAAAGGGAAGQAGSTFTGRLTSGSTLGGAAGAGLGSAAATLLTGGDVETAAKSGVGSAAGYAVGTAIGGPIGGMIGGSIGGAIGGGSVICTELNRQGLISDFQLAIETQFAVDHIPMATRRGYWIWAKPYVKLMQKKGFVGKVATQIGLAMFNKRFDAVLFEMGMVAEKSSIGNAIRFFGEGACYAIGCLLSDTVDARLKMKGI